MAVKHQRKVRITVTEPIPEEQELSWNKLGMSPNSSRRGSFSSLSPPRNIKSSDRRLSPPKYEHSWRRGSWVNILILLINACFFFILAVQGTSPISVDLPPRRDCAWLSTNFLFGSIWARKTCTNLFSTNSVWWRSTPIFNRMYLNYLFHLT